MKKRRHNESGQSLLELALMLPFLLLLMLGIVELGRAAFISLKVDHAAFAAAAWGVQDPTTANNNLGMTNTALADARLDGLSVVPTQYCQCSNSNSGSGSGVSCTTIQCPANTQVVEFVNVTTHASFNSLFNYPGLPNTFQANGIAIMRVRR